MEGVEAKASTPKRILLHAVTGHLVVRMSGQSLNDAGLRTFLTGSLLPEVVMFRDAGNVIQQADFDVSHNSFTDVGFRALLKAWAKTEAACPIIIKAHANLLTDVSLSYLAAFIRVYRGQVRELHLTHNKFRDHDAIISLFQGFVGLPQYPMWIRRQRRFAPVYIRLGSCGLAEPANLLNYNSSQNLARICCMDNVVCSKTLCSLAPRSDSRDCPLLHLYGFLEQDAHVDSASSNIAHSSGDCSSEFCAVALDCEESRSRADGSPRLKRLRSDNASAATSELHSSSMSFAATSCQASDSVKVFPCGACGRSLPLDMFGRHQFRKASSVDTHPIDDNSQALGHVIRRCNDCVVQPCMACGVELPLSSFAKGQMMRPRGQRRCRECAFETILCARCGLPKPRSSFSAVEARRRNVLPRFCIDCDQVNIYFERRYAIVLLFGSARHRAKRCPKDQLPALPLGILRRIVALSEPGDEFIQVRDREFTCHLCCRSWSISTNDVDRHVRHSQLHQQRLEKVEKGSLVRIRTLDIDPDRFRNGLGITGAVCSLHNVEEARGLTHVTEIVDQGIPLERLRMAGLGEECFWVSSRLLESAMELRLGSVPVSDFASAEGRSAQRRWKLFGYLEPRSSDPDGFNVDADDLSAVQAMLDG